MEHNVNSNFEKGLKIVIDFVNDVATNSNGARACFEAAQLEGNPYAQDAINLLQIRKKKHLGIFITLKKACIDENAWSQYEMGIAYEKGINQLMPSKGDALRWFELAAKNGQLDALNRIIWYYRDREKVLELNHSIDNIDDRDWHNLMAITDETNFSELFEILVSATYIKKEDKYTVDRQLRMGLAYDEGCMGLKPSDENAVRWYLIAAGNGSREAQSKLGWHYVEGLGVEKDIEKAKQWYQKSAGNGYNHARLMLASRIFNSDTKNLNENVSPSFTKNLEEELRKYQELSGMELRSATDSDIEKTEEILGFKLPEAYKCFVKICNGIFYLNGMYEELYINGLSDISESAQTREGNLIKHSFELYGDGYGNGLYWDSWTGLLFNFEHEYIDGNYPEGIKMESLESAILGVLQDINKSINEDCDVYEEDEWEE